MAEIPKTMIRSLKNGMATTVSLPPTIAFLASILLKIINNTNEILQIKVNFEKNEINFMR
jgi:hypothetical protein